MTKVTIDPGVCGLITKVEAVSEDGQDVTVKVDSACKAVQGMFEALGPDYDAYEICLCKPGENEFYEYAGEHFPGHASCPTIAGIVKCMEVECKLALAQDVSITFEKD